ncbi:hypothetical protein [Cupriavidus agavae]|uniref:Uncharacterized protein n=1 Tax=Cupriavidus agavae TaxID=1001822 RepID=A0A4Q7RS01_9BURK|nr:hypothetical protein [Cupriavidus agavae]RZT35400.1 hypothetical protein EV147_3836 [Cupriavidus agavae]
MFDFFFYLLAYILPAYLGFRLSKEQGRSIWAWTIACTVFSWFGVIALVLSRPGPPTAQQYAKANPGNAAGGMSCNRCGSRSIRVWREQAFIKVRQYHICNHCGTTLYRSM